MKLVNKHKTNCNNVCAERVASSEIISNKIIDVYSYRNYFVVEIFSYSFITITNKLNTIYSLTIGGCRILQSPGLINIH